RRDVDLDRHEEAFLRHLGAELVRCESGTDLPLAEIPTPANATSVGYSTLAGVPALWAERLATLGPVAAMYAQRLVANLCQWFQQVAGLAGGVLPLHTTTTQCRAIKEHVDTLLRFRVPGTYDYTVQSSGVSQTVLLKAGDIVYGRLRHNSLARLSVAAGRLTRTQGQPTH